MPEVQDKVTRFSAELVDAAAAEGLRQSRSARQQLDHWVRVGRAVSAAESAQRTRVEDALAGRVQMRELSTHEAVVMNAEIGAKLEEAFASADFGAELAAEGVTTVSLDGEGRLVEHHPDGTTSILDAV